MNRILFLALVLGLVGFLCADDAYAHGGSFRGPNGGVPPGLREPSDPEPPPPPPSDPGDPGGPTTPGGPAPAPETPTPDGGHETPGDSGGPAPVGPSGGGPKKAQTTKNVTFESWRFWWGYNNDDILNLKSHIYSERTSSSSPIFFSAKKDEENRRNATRPTERAVIATIIPALKSAIDRPDDHEDVQGGAIVALGKIGSAKYIPDFEAAIWNRYQNEKGQAIKFGYQATESAVLALGLLPNIEAATRDTIRRICLNVIDDDKLRSRERAWAAVCLGLQRDGGAVRPLVERLQKSYSDDNIPAGILCGIGLIGNCEETQSIREALEEGLRKGVLFGKEISSDRIRSFVGYALMKIGSPESLPAMISVLESRKQGRIAKRSAAIAVGVLGRAEPDEAKKGEAVAALLKYINNSGGDTSGENFAIIGLSQIGTEKALTTLMDLCDNGQYGQRPFAALGLGTYVFYNDRAAAEGKSAAMDKVFRKKIVDRIAKLSEKYKDADTKAAFMLARGLMRDTSATEELVSIVSSRSEDGLLRGFCCVSLGLMGDASAPVKDALKLALDERKSVDLRRDAATGLGLLRDADVVKILLEELKQAKSFAVQGQLITAIGTIGDHTAIAPLVQILDDRTQNTATRAMAAVGLGMIGDLREMPALGRLSQNYNYRASVPDLDELLFIL
jgi:HEAT repeat protein